MPNSLLGLLQNAMQNDHDVRVAAVASAVGLVVGLSAVAVHAQTNLVANGSFEAGPASKGQL